MIAALDRAAHRIGAASEDRERRCESARLRELCIRDRGSVRREIDEASIACERLPPGTASSCDLCAGDQRADVVGRANEALAQRGSGAREVALREKCIGVRAPEATIFRLTSQPNREHLERVAQVRARQIDPREAFVRARVGRIDRERIAEIADRAARVAAAYVRLCERAQASRAVLARGWIERLGERALRRRAERARQREREQNGCECSAQSVECSSGSAVIRRAPALRVRRRRRTARLVRCGA